MAQETQRRPTPKQTQAYYERALRAAREKGVTLDSAALMGLSRRARGVYGPVDYPPDEDSTELSQRAEHDIRTADVPRTTGMEGGRTVAGNLSAGDASGLGQRAQGVVNLLTAIVPQRIADEEFGDLLEDIHRRIARGERKLVYLRLAYGIALAIAHSIGYLRKVWGKKAG